MLAVVAADLGVVKAAERGVKGVLILGESSVLAERIPPSTGVLPARTRLAHGCCVRRGTAELEVGITRGVKLFGDNGCLSPSSCSSLVGAVGSTAWFCFQCPGALIDRSWNGGRPGMVAESS